MFKPLIMGVVALGSMAVLQSCLTTAGKRMPQYEAKLIGKTKVQLLQCAGVPNGRYVSGKSEIVSYQASEILGDSDGVQTYQCRANVTMVNDIVTRANVNGDQNMLGFEVCSSIFKRC